MRSNPGESGFERTPRREGSQKSRFRRGGCGESLVSREVTNQNGIREQMRPDEVQGRDEVRQRFRLSV